MKKDALTGAPWLLAVARVFERAGEAVYLVGGAVRNPLMGLPLSDVDMCGPARPERVMALCEGTQVRAVLRAARFQAELDLAPTPALLDSLARHASLLRDIACERLRDEWQKTLLADLRYPMLKRRAPATASGLKTLWDCGAWPYLLDAPYDVEAVNALAALGWEDAPLAGRLALLLREMKPSELQSALLRLRFSTRDAVLAARYGAALRHFATQQDGAFETVQLGRDAVTYAAVAFQALGDAADEARAKGALDALRDAPWSLRELAVGGDALMPLLTARDVPARQMGRLLETLWRMAVEGHIQNETAALLRAADEWLSGME